MWTPTAGSVQWFEAGSEVAQDRGFVNEPVAGQFAGAAGNVLADLDHVVDMALCICPPWDRQPHEVHRGGLLRTVRLAAEHDCADLAATHPACLVERDCERLTGVLEWRDLREQGSGVHVNRVPADRGQYRQSDSLQGFAEVTG